MYRENNKKHMDLYEKIRTADDVVIIEIDGSGGLPPQPGLDLPTFEPIEQDEGPSIGAPLSTIAVFVAFAVIYIASKL